MKRHIAFILLLVLTAFAAGSCKKNDPEAPPKPLSCKIDGVLWNSNLSSTARIVKSPTSGEDQLVIAGTDVANTITITVPAKVGVYDLKNIAVGNVNLLVAPSSSFISNLCISNPEGTVEITSIDMTNKTVSGKFSARVCPATAISPAKVISEGSINSVKITN